MRKLISHSVNGWTLEQYVQNVTGTPFSEVASMLSDTLLPARRESGDADPMRGSPPLLHTWALPSTATGLRAQTIDLWFVTMQVHSYMITREQ